MKIVLIASSYAPHIGGLQTVVASLARELQANGRTVCVVVPRHPRELPAFEVVAGIPVYRQIFLVPRLSYLTRGRPQLFFAGLLVFPLTLVWLLWFLRRERAAVVNLHFVGAPALFVALAQAIQKFRLIVSLHGYDVAGLAGETGFQRWIFGFTLGRAEWVTAPSRALADDAVRVLPSARGRLEVIPNGVAECPDAGLGMRPNWLPQAEFLLAVGRLERVKGMDVLVEAMALVGKRGLRLPLVIIGEGGEGAALKQLAEQHGLSQIRFVGAQPHAVVLETMRLAALVIVPSRNESFGLTALEAFWCGKAVIASRVGGLPEIVHEGETGWLTPSEDAPALAEVIVTAWEEPQTRREYGQKGKAMVRSTHSWKAVTECYVRLFAESRDATGN